LSAAAASLAATRPACACVSCSSSSARCALTASSVTCSCCRLEAASVAACEGREGAGRGLSGDAMLGFGRRQQSRGCLAGQAQPSSTPAPPQAPAANPRQPLAPSPP
jgi:hypothetical protein